MIRNLLRNKQGRWLFGCVVLALFVAVVMLVSAGSPASVRVARSAKTPLAQIAGGSISTPAIPPVSSGSSRSIAQNGSALGSASIRTVWAAPADVVGDKLNLASATPQNSARVRSMKGRSGSLSASSMVDLSTLRAGDALSLPLFDGEIVSGKVNLVKTETAQSVRVGGSLTGKSEGTFSISKVNGAVSARILFPKRQVAYLISGNEKEELSIVEQPLSNVVCMPYFRAAAPVPAESSTVPVPLLSSRPTAVAVIYLDFDGATIKDPDWLGGQTIIAPPLPLNGDQMTEAWSRVKEDYMPFNVDVTTDASRYDAAPVGRRMRVIITSNDIVAPGAGGVAYLTSFANAGGDFSSDIPCWVFNTEALGIGEAASHEVGHTLGLSHDGRFTPDEEYYEGQGTGAVSWAPIMGVGYYRTLSQWSKGEYLSANNQEDDLAIISSETNGFGYIADEAGSIPSYAGILTRNSSAGFTQTGTIEHSGDSDYYAFYTGACTINVSALPIPGWTNLDVSLRLINSSNVTLATNNPVDDTKAALTYTVPQGLYFIEAKGVGRGDPLDDGYTDYGSLGAYTLAGSIPGDVFAPVFVGPGEVGGLIGEFFSYRVAATSATSYKVVGALPDGLTFSPVTGLISGVPSTPGTYGVILQASNSVGTTSRRIVFRIASSPVPELTSEPSLDAIVYVPLQYQITATNSPTYYATSDLPKGLTLDPKTGLITGRPLLPGITTVRLAATNSGGTGNQIITIRVLASASNLATAVEANAGIWTTGGAAPWKLTPKSRAFDRVDAARSGVIGDNKESWMQAQIEGPMTVTFRWGVDSEVEYDRLMFKIDNTTYATISGSSPGRVPKWRFRSFAIPSGTHILRWVYKKDFTLAAKTDAGYVDTVTFTPRPNF